VIWKTKSGTSIGKAHSSDGKSTGNRERLTPQSGREGRSEVSEYVAHEPRAADFLRMAKEQNFDNGDWEKLSQLARIAGLGNRKRKRNECPLAA